MKSISHISTSEVVWAHPISQVWTALGGGPLRSSRGRAFWRKGDGFNVALCDKKNTYYDHARGEGGGVLDLIQTVLACSRADAFRWLAEYTGISLTSYAPQELAGYARRRHTAVAEAQELVWWRDDQLEVVRDYRNMLLKTYHSALRFLTRHTFEECESRGDWRFELSWDVLWAFEPKIDHLDRAIDLLASTPFASLLPYFRARQRRAK